MAYCEKCGCQLIEKELADEGIIPYCEMCGEYRFPLSNTAVSMIVLSPDQTKILLIQQYGKMDWILVAGYVNQKECLEDALHREYREEIGRSIMRMQYMKSAYFEASNTLMCNYVILSDSISLQALHRQEVDEAKWFSFAQARQEIKQNSLAQHFLYYFMEEWEKGNIRL